MIPQYPLLSMGSILSTRFRILGLSMNCCFLLVNRNPFHLQAMLATLGRQVSYLLPLYVCGLLKAFCSFPAFILQNGLSFSCSLYKKAFKLRPCWIFCWNVQPELIQKLIFDVWVISYELIDAIYHSAYLCAFIFVFWRWKVLHGNSKQHIFCGSRSCQTGIHKKATGKWCVFHQRDNGCYGGGRSYHVWLPALWCWQSFLEKCKWKWYE